MMKKIRPIVFQIHRFTTQIGLKLVYNKNIDIGMPDASLIEQRKS